MQTKRRDDVAADEVVRCPETASLGYYSTNSVSFFGCVLVRHHGCLAEDVMSSSAMTVNPNQRDGR